MILLTTFPDPPKLKLKQSAEDFKKFNAFIHDKVNSASLHGAAQQQRKKIVADRWIDSVPEDDYRL